ncbi:hypothetical protein BN1723_001014, partial [Verticillium longisporum]
EPPVPPVAADGDGVRRRGPRPAGAPLPPRPGLHPRHGVRRQAAPRDEPRHHADGRLGRRRGRRQR